MPAGVERFDVFPYLVTRIGRTPLRHIALLPAGLRREQLLDLARKQALANRLDTCLCLGPTDAIYVTADGVESTDAFLPWGLAITGGLQTAAPAEASPELAARQSRLDAFVERHRGSGYLVGDGLESGRPATADEIGRLSGRSEDGAPKGLELCQACGSFRGECLAPGGDGTDDAGPRVVSVHCRCDNHNRCARCGATLADTRLSAYFYDQTARKVLYAAAYMALAHRCRPALTGDRGGSRSELADRGSPRGAPGVGS